MTALTVSKLTATIGAEIGGVQLSGGLPDETITQIHDLLLEHKVIFFRDQHLTAADHIAFGRRFGDVEIHPLTPKGQEHPELFILKTGGGFGGPDIWHSDVTWRPEPSLGSILAARVVPPEGGDTLWADMGGAYDALDEETRDQIDGLVAVHDYTRAFGRNATQEVREKMRSENPSVEHPVVRTHPETGRSTLYVNASFTSHIVGMDGDASATLLARLYRQASIPDVQCRFKWTQGAVAFWDNRATQHYAVNDYLPAKRVMERVTVVGDKPYYRA